MIASVFTVISKECQTVIEHLADKFGKAKGILVYPISDNDILVATETYADYHRIKEELFTLVEYESKGGWNIGTKELK